jgi:hypothetical protein
MKNILFIQLNMNLTAYQSLNKLTFTQQNMRHLCDKVSIEILLEMTGMKNYLITIFLVIINRYTVCIAVIIISLGLIIIYVILDLISLIYFHPLIYL